MVGKVAIDASSASSGGAIRLLSGILPALARTSPGTTYCLLNRASQRSLLPSLPPNIQWHEIPRATQSLPVRLLWLQVGLPRLLRRLNADMLLGASDVSTWRPPCPYVLMVHNFNPFSPMRSDMWGRKRLARLALQRELVRRCARRADRVVFVSEWSRSAMSQAMGIPLEKSAVVHHGVDEIFLRTSPDSDKQSDGHPFLLVVSAILEHKNLKRLVEAYSDLATARAEELDLVIAGPIGSPKLRSSLEGFLQQRGLTPRVRFLGSVPSEELASLYRQAELLVFPSVEETFGLPLIEAMASGLPVVASKVSVMPEICGDAVQYFDPFDVADMTRMLERTLNDTALREDMGERGLARAADFSWDRTARGLLTVMSTVAGAGGGPAQASG